MTLRYGHDGKPCGLDWTVCNDGNPQPEVWGMNPAPKPKPVKEKPEPKPRAEGRVQRNRLAPEVEAEIIRLYRDRRLSANEVGRRCGTTAVTVFKVLERNGVPARSKSEAMTLYHANA